MKMGIGTRICIIIAIQISLIAGSFAYLAYFESKNTLLGNSINIAGKNRFLTSNVLLQSEYYLSGTSQKSDVEDALVNLKSNILALRDGGNLGGIELDPIPPQFIENWEAVYGDYLAVEEETQRLVSPKASAPRPAELEADGNKLIAASDTLVSRLGEYAKDNSRQLLTLQIGLGVLNLAVNVGMLYTILRTLYPIKLLTKATAALQKGTLDVFVKQAGNHELRDLAESFNSMVKSLKRSSESLELEKRRYKELYDSAPDLYRVVNTDGVLLDCNESYWRQLGYSSKEEIIGKSVFETTADTSRQAMHDCLETWKRTGIVVNREIWLKRKDGTILPTLLSATALRDKYGKIIESNTCIIDVTEIYKARNELEAANARLKELDTMKTEFIGIASHELRTPIQPILTYAELAREGLIGQDKAWEVVTREARRLKNLANQILDATRIEGGGIRLVFEDYSVNEVIRDVIQELEDSSGTNVQIRAELAPDADLIINADRSRMNQVIDNILGNALKFTNEGNIDVKTSSVYDGRYVEVLMRDTGGGIPAEILPKLFEKFATKSRHKGTENGTGLGLFICKGIINAHGGSIIGYNNENGGATFKIWLRTAKKSVIVQDIAPSSS